MDPIAFDLALFRNGCWRCSECVKHNRLIEKLMFYVAGRRHFLCPGEDCDHKRCESREMRTRHIMGSRIRKVSKCSRLSGGSWTVRGMDLCMHAIDLQGNGHGNTRFYLLWFIWSCLLWMTMRYNITIINCPFKFPNSFPRCTQCERLPQCVISSEMEAPPALLAVAIDGSTPLYYYVPLPKSQSATRCARPSRNWVWWR